MFGCKCTPYGMGVWDSNSVLSRFCLSVSCIIGSSFHFEMTLETWGILLFMYVYKYVYFPQHNLSFYNLASDLGCCIIRTKNCVLYCHCFVFEVCMFLFMRFKPNLT